jgi:hypothetical protein
VSFRILVYKSAVNFDILNLNKSFISVNQNKTNVSLHSTSVAFNVPVYEKHFFSLDVSQVWVIKYLVLMSHNSLLSNKILQETEWQMKTALFSVQIIFFIIEINTLYLKKN